MSSLKQILMNSYTCRIQIAVIATVHYYHEVLIHTLENKKYCKGIFTGQRLNFDRLRKFMHALGIFFAPNHLNRTKTQTSIAVKKFE